MVFDQTKDFFQRYYLQYWITKTESLYYQLNHLKKISALLSENDFFRESKDPEKLLKNMITFDLHFLKFQIIEALFSLIFALETSNEEEIWFNLSIPNEASKRNFKLYDRIASIKSRRELIIYLKKKIFIQDQEIEFWKVLFFHNENEIQEEKKVFENILRILWSFRNQFKDRGDYNAYKHGLRCMGSSIYLSWAKEEQYGIPLPNFKEKLQPLGYAENVITFLEKVKKKGDTKIILRSKAFSTHEDYTSIIQAYRLISNIVSSRRKDNKNQMYKFLSLEQPKKTYSLSNFSLTQIDIKELYEQARIKIQDQKIDEAILDLKKILHIDGNHSEANFYLGYCFLILSTYEDALEHFNLHIEKNFTNLREYALYYAGFCYGKMEMYKEMDKKFQFYFRSPPEDKPVFLKKARYTYCDFLVKYSESLDSVKIYQKRSVLKKAVKHISNAGKMKFEYPESWFRLGNALLDIEMYEEGISIYLSILDNVPETDARNTYIMLSCAYIQTENYQKAEEKIRQAINLDKKYTNSWNLLAGILIKQKRYEEVVENLKNAEKYDIEKQNKLGILNNWGIYYIGIEDYHLAEDKFNTMLEIDPTNELAIKNMINCLMAQNCKNPEQILELTKTFKEDVTNFLQIKARAYAFAHLNRFSEAYSLIESLKIDKSKANEKWVHILDSKGDFFELEGKSLMAQEFWEKSLKESLKDYEFTEDTKKKLKKSIEKKK